MALLNLIARLGLDSSGFEAGLDKSTIGAAKFARKFQSSIVSTVGQFFTLGFALNLVDGKIKQLQGDAEGFSLPEGTLADRFREQQQELLDAEETLAGRYELRQKTKQTEAQYIDEVNKQLKEELALYEQIDSNNLKRLSDEERLNELIQRRNDLKRGFLEGRIAPGFESKALQGMEGLDQEILDLRHGLTRSQTRNIGAGSLDPLARIGGFTGGADVKIVTIQERIANATEKTAENTAGNKVGFR